MAARDVGRARERRAERSGRRLGRALAALALFAGAESVAGCLCPSHPPAALAAAGFRTPRQTFETFLAAFDYRVDALEFRCLSAGFRRRNRVSELTWREFRDQLEREHPLLPRLAARAEVVEEREDGPDGHWIVARAAGRTVRMRFVRELFYEIYERGELASDGRPEPAPPWSLDRDGLTLDARVRVDPADLATGTATLNAESISEFRAGYEWKLDDLVEESSARP
jgi:hypothetical protein